MAGQKGITFDGSASYADSPTLSIGLTFSISCWFKTLTSTSGVFRAIADLENNLNTLGVRLGIQNNHIFGNLDGGNTLEGSINIQDGMWHHMVWVFDGVNMKMYVDNVADGSTTAVPTAISGILTLGKDVNVPTFTSGSIKELILWNSGISTTTISNDYNSGSGTYNTNTSGMTVAYHLNGDTNDFVGSNNLTQHSSPSFSNAIVAINTANSTTKTLQYNVSGYTSRKDAHMTQFNPTFNTGANGFFEVGNYNASSNESTPILYDAIESQSIPSNANIEAAWETDTIQGTRNSSSPAKQFAAYYVKRAWNEGTGTGVDGQAANANEVTWNSAKSGSVNWTTAGAQDTTNDRDNTKQDEIIPMTVAAGTKIKMTLTDYVQLVVNGSITNNGIVYVRTSNFAANGTYDFYSKEDATASNRPLLTIIYTVPTVDKADPGMMMMGVG